MSRRDLQHKQQSNCGGKSFATYSSKATRHVFRVSRKECAIRKGLRQHGKKKKRERKNTGKTRKDAEGCNHQPFLIAPPINIQATSATIERQRPDEHLSADDTNDNGTQDTILSYGLHKNTRDGGSGQRIMQRGVTKSDTLRTCNGSRVEHTRPRERHYPTHATSNGPDSRYRTWCLQQIYIRT